MNLTKQKNKLLRIFIPLLIVLGGVGYFLSEKKTAFLILFIVSNLNLVATTNVIQILLSVEDVKNPTKKGNNNISYLFWVPLKLSLLVFLGILLWRYQSLPGMTLLLGISPACFMPIIGGSLWGYLNK